MREDNRMMYKKQRNENERRLSISILNFEMGSLILTILSSNLGECIFADYYFNLFYIILFDVQTCIRVYVFIPYPCRCLLHIMLASLSKRYSDSMKVIISPWKHVRRYVLFNLLCLLWKWKNSIPLVVALVNVIICGIIVDIFANISITILFIKSWFQSDCKK